MAPRRRQAWRSTTRFRGQQPRRLHVTLHFRLLDCIAASCGGFASHNTALLDMPWLTCTCMGNPASSSCVSMGIYLGNHWLTSPNCERGLCERGLSRYRMRWPALTAGLAAIAALVLGIIGVSGGSHVQTAAGFPVPLRFGLWRACADTPVGTGTECLPITKDNIRLLFSGLGAVSSVPSIGTIPAVPSGIGVPPGIPGVSRRVRLLGLADTVNSVLIAVQPQDSQRMTLADSADDAYSAVVAARVLLIIAVVFIGIVLLLSFCLGLLLSSKAGLGVNAGLAGVALACAVVAISLVGAVKSRANNQTPVDFVLGSSWVISLIFTVFIFITLLLLLLSLCVRDRPLPTTGRLGVLGKAGAAAAATGAEGGDVELAIRNPPGSVTRATAPAG